MTSTDRKASSQWVIGKTEPIEKYYTLGKKLGQPGQFGFAQEAQHKTTKAVRAVKVVSKARFHTTTERNFHFDSLRAEIEVMRKLEHPNIIKFYEVFETEKDLFIVMELCTGGELFDRISAEGAFSEAKASKMLRGMFTAIAYLHSKKIAHCDLKPDNFLFINKNADSPIKVIDFGMAKFVSREKFTALCGTPYYVAPEVLAGRYSEHCDMWSLGVVMFVMLFGYPPFYADPNVYKDKTDDKIFELVRKGFSPETKEGYGAHFPKAIPISDSAKDLIVKLLNKDTAKRLTAAESLEHPWLVGTTASDKPFVSNVLSNLKAFNGTCKFKNAVLNLMTDYLGQDELAALKKTFTAIDENGDGTITLVELKKAFAKGGSDLKLSEPELENLLKIADVDGDGALSYQELLSTSVHRKLIAKEERLWDAFSRLDSNGDGRVSAEEIAAVLGDTTKAKEIIAEVDLDGNGSVDYEEFLRIFHQKETLAEKTEGKSNSSTAGAKS